MFRQDAVRHTLFTSIPARFTICGHAPARLRVESAGAAPDGGGTGPRPRPRLWRGRQPREPAAVAQPGRLVQREPDGPGVPRDLRTLPSVAGDLLARLLRGGRPGLSRTEPDVRAGL